MLTNIYYYNAYKPFIFKRQPSGTAGGSLSRGTRLKDVPDARSEGEGGLIQLTKNSSSRSDVLRYAQDICKNVTEMKDAAKYLSYNAGSYYMNVLNEGFEPAKDWAVEDMSGFVNAYNGAVAFCGTQEHSPELARYARDIMDTVAENAGMLEGFGVDLSESGRVMSFQPERLRDMDYLQFGAALSEAGQAAESIYNRTRELLTQPITEHMDFKQLSYYYNYRIDRRQPQTAAQTPNRAFSLIESGLIFDRII